MAVFEESMFNAPIAGQGLTEELGSTPWQHPPQYATVDDAMNFYAERIMSPNFKEDITDVMELGVPLTTLANALQLGAVMQGKHTIDVGVLITPVIVEMLSYVGDAAGVEYSTGLEKEEADPDKIKDSHIALAMQKVRQKMEEAGETVEEEPTEVEPPQEEEPVEEAPTGLMARR